MSKNKKLVTTHFRVNYMSEAGGRQGGEEIEGRIICIKKKTCILRETVLE